MQVQDFIQECIERAGGAAELRAPGLMDVLLPPELEPVAGGKPLLALALDTDAFSLEPQAELATVGSPFVDALIAAATARGMTAIGHLAATRLKKKGLREEVERNLIFSHCRIRYDTGEPDVLTCYYAQFNFKVDFLSDERRERLYVVPVNLWSNLVNLALAERLPDLDVTEEDATGLAASRVGVEDAYATARHALQQLVGEEIALHEARSRKRFAVEFARISDYYAQVARELQRRQQREDDAKRAQSLTQKLDAAAAERERKLRELGEKYRLRLRARLTSARLLAQPKTFFKVFVDRGQTTRTLTLAYDPVLERLEPPVCEACRSETTRLHVSSSAQLLCPGCAEKKV